MPFIIMQTDAKGVNGIRGRLRKGKKIRGEVEAATHESGRELHGLITESSPVESGQYKSRWRLDQEGLSSLISNDTEYANRLIHGFVGIDSRGRHYSDPIRHDVVSIVEGYRPKYHKNIRRVLKGFIG